MNEVKLISFYLYSHHLHIKVLFPYVKYSSQMLNIKQNVITMIYTYMYIILILLQAKEESQISLYNPSVQTEITIIITDINDETPTFRSATYLGEINENAQNNTPVTFIGNSIPQVYDYDQVCKFLYIKQSRLSVSRCQHTYCYQKFYSWKMFRRFQ